LFYIYLIASDTENNKGQDNKGEDNEDQRRKKEDNLVELALQWNYIDGALPILKSRKHNMQTD
jgi:hypothetical protein